MVEKLLTKKKKAHIFAHIIVKLILIPRKA